MIFAGDHGKGIAGPEQGPEHAIETRYDRVQRNAAALNFKNLKAVFGQGFADIGALVTPVHSPFADQSPYQMDHFADILCPGVLANQRMLTDRQRSNQMRRFCRNFSYG
jgi:hypothetical protein